jgi:putative peptide zinc metalloprotease protein
MDVPRSSSLGQLDLHLSTEAQGYAYLVADRSTGRIISIPRQAVLALKQVMAALRGSEDARALVGEDEAREATGVVGYLKSLRDLETGKRTSFNPISMQFAVPLPPTAQSRAVGLSHILISWGFVLGFVALTGVFLALSLSSDWAIGREFTGILSIEALLSFGLIAPVLKIVHEAGHLLAATRYAVPVRRVGLNLIGLYPLPFVDCSEADVAASRRQRVVISLAGLWTDLTIGLIAGIAWHFLEGDFLQTLAGRVFVFSTLNSVLFNGNPLMKMDGYYALCDLVGRRNLSSRATKAFADLRNYLMTLGAAGDRPKGWSQWGFAAFGLATFAYRFAVIYSLLTSLMPQYLGLGAVLSLWGAVVMFLSPILTDRATPAKPTSGQAMKRHWGRRMIFLAFLAALGFLPLPYVQRVDLRPDVQGSYTLTVPKAGYLASAGTHSLGLENPDLDREISIAQMALDVAVLNQSLTSGGDPAKAKVAADNVASAGSKLAILKRDRDRLAISLPKAGVWVPLAAPKPGEYLADGMILGALYPTDGSTLLTGAFPERFVEKFDDSLASLEIRFGGQFLTVPYEAAKLVEEVGLDAQSGTRSFTLKLSIPLPPADLAGQDVSARVVFAAEPIWNHLAFWLQGRIAAFRDAQISDRENRIDRD